MFCPECGKKNEEGATFCESCGAKIEETKVIKPKAPKKKMAKKNKIIITVVVILAVVLIGGGLILSNNYKPSKVALNYFKALMNNDTDKLYDYSNITKNEFTTKKIFKEVTDSKKTNVLNYSVTDEQISSDGLSAQVKISYTTEGNSSALSKTIYLVKDKKNKMLIFDNWKISEGSSLVTENYEITTFKDATLKLEGVTVNKSYKKSSSSKKYDTYVIPQLFKGSYDAEVTLKNGLTLESEIDVSSYSSTIDTIKLSDKDEKALETSIKKVVNDLYTSAIAQKAFSDIKGNYEYTGGSLTKLESAYNSFTNYIKSSGLTEYSVTDVEVQRLSMTDDGYIYVNVDIDYKYTAKAYFSEETVSKTDDDTAYLTFDYNDGFKLVNVSSLATYFSRY